MNWLKKMCKKAQMGGFDSVVVSFIVVVIVIALGATILSNIRDTQGSSSTPNTAYNVSTQGLSSMKTFGDQLPTIAIVAVAGLILMLVGGFLVRRTA